MRWLRADERAGARNRALAYTEFYAGTRGQTVALHLDDMRVSARKGLLIVRYGKGGKYREVPLHPKLRAALQAWLVERAKLPGAANNPALFLNHRGGRLSPAAPTTCLPPSPPTPTSPSAATASSHHTSYDTAPEPP